MGCMPWEEGITNLTDMQAAWIFAQTEADRKEEFEEKLALAEYIASFINPGAVQKARELRNNKQRFSEKDLVDALATISGDKERASRAVRELNKDGNQG